MLEGLAKPLRDQDTAPFWEGCEAGVLRLPYSEAAGSFFWPPGPAADGRPPQWRRAGGRGSVYSWVVVHAPLDEALADQVPYAVGMIDLEEGVRIVSTIEGVDPDRIEAGMEVRARFGRLADGRGMFTFVPARGEG